MNEQASAWLNVVDGLAHVHERMRRVTILSRDALDVICQQGGPRTLFYCEPPYLLSTRTAPDVYGPHEMSRADHKELLRALAKIKGKFLLSGYPSALYDFHARCHGWKCHTFDLPNNAAGTKTKRRMTECVWMNY